MTEKQLEKKILDGGRTLLFSNEDLKRLIIPLVIDQVLVRTVGMADTMMISSVGEAAISGVSLVDMINMLINAVFAAVATGGAVIASQYLGHRDRKKACEASSQLMVVTAVCALLFTVLSLAARKPLLSLLFGQIDADVMDAALTYLTVSALSFPFLASFNSSSALFRAMNDSRTPTVVSLGMNVMNLIGNSILIFGMKWGVAGAAISTLLSRVMAAAVMFALSLNRERQLYVRPDQMTRFQPTLIGQILYIGIPSGIENGIFELGRIVVVSMISTFGTVQIAANAVANNLDGLGVLAGAAMNLAILTVVGRCVGAHDNDQVRYYTRKLLKIEYAMMVVVNVVLLAALPLILNLYTLSPASRELATQLIFIHDGFAMLLVATALVGLGITLVVSQRLVPVAPDGCVQTIADVAGWEFGRAKYTFDAAFLLLTLGYGMLRVGWPVGIGLGTLAAVCLTGGSCSLWRRLIGRYL